MSRIFYLLVFIFPISVFAEGTHNHNHHDHHHESPAGKPGEMNAIEKTIKVDLLDSMRFNFGNEPQIRAGETIKFVVNNLGKLPHEFSIGTEDEHKQHRTMMRKHPNMKHVDGNTITVPPGETKTIIWTFGKLDAVMVACNIPGHFEAGMKHIFKLSDDN